MASYAVLAEFVGQIRLGLESHAHAEKLHGAIVLCECAYTIANTPDKFQTVFEALQLMLKDTIEKMIESFRLAVEEIKANPQSLNDPTSTPAVKLTSSLALILAWVTMHSKILERFESQNYFGFDHFVRSNAYSTVLV